MAEMTAREFLKQIQSICAKNTTCDKCEIRDLCFKAHPPLSISEKVIDRYIKRLELCKEEGKEDEGK